MQLDSKNQLTQANNMINNNRSIRQLLIWLIRGTKGGNTRARIIKTLKINPQNSNQLATTLQVNYKTIRHHLAILEKNRLINSTGDHYSTAHFLSELMEENYGLFEEITSAMKNIEGTQFKVIQKCQDIPA